MKVIDTKLAGVLLIEPDVYADSRGFFMETYRESRYQSVATGRLVQDNISYSSKGVLRGLHFQYPNPQGKLVSVLQGEVFDVVVDIRVGSPTFGQWFGHYLSAENKEQLWIPEGFAHGFCVTSDSALLHYKCTNYYSADSDMSLRWDDPAIGITWPVDKPILSDKDAHASVLSEIPVNKLPILL